ncbi:MAG TPA: DUF481 domain-containing protein [Gammaproteobacteria bacterium]|nr:DUF481 domain-containing protein [Gammaproteobacteria bacterium]
MSVKVLPLASAALLATSVAQADGTFNDINTNADAAKTAAVDQGWQGSVALGMLSTTGNSETSSENGKGVFGYRGGPWQDAFLLQTLKASNAGTVIAESTEANAQTDYNFTDKNYLFGNLDYLRDVFSGYERRTSEVTGLGRRLFSSDTQQLDGQLGVGGRQTRYTDATRSSELVEMAAGSYLWKFGGNSSFAESLSFEHGRTNNFTQSVTSLTTNLANSFALSISYTVKHNSRVLAGLKNNDTITTLSLVYSFPPPAPPAAPAVCPPPATVPAPAEATQGTPSGSL